MNNLVKVFMIAGLILIAWLMIMKTFEIVTDYKIRKQEINQMYEPYEIPEKDISAE